MARPMRFRGYEDKIVRILEPLYQDTMSAVRVDRELSEWFLTIIGLMQGFLSPVLFNILLEVMIVLALEGNDIGATISGNLIRFVR